MANENLTESEEEQTSLFENKTLCLSSTVSTDDITDKISEALSMPNEYVEVQVIG